MPLDLSRVLFVATANATEQLHSALLDRLEVIEMSGYTLDESCGKTLAILQGPQTDRTAVSTLMRDVANQHASHMVVTNYHKSGEPFRNLLRVFPLSAASQKGAESITCYLGTCRCALSAMGVWIDPWTNGCRCA